MKMISEFLKFVPRETNNDFYKSRLIYKEMFHMKQN